MGTLNVNNEDKNAGVVPTHCSGWWVLSKKLLEGRPNPYPLCWVLCENAAVCTSSLLFFSWSCQRRPTPEEFLTAWQLPSDLWVFQAPVEMVPSSSPSLYRPQDWVPGRGAREQVSSRHQLSLHKLQALRSILNLHINQLLLLDLFFGSSDIPG